MCWVALDRGLRLGEACGYEIPAERWRRTAAEIRTAICDHGIDHERGVFVRAFDSKEMDAVLLRLPTVGYVGFDDETMVRTTDEVASELELWAPPAPLHAPMTVLMWTRAHSWRAASGLPSAWPDRAAASPPGKRSIVPPPLRMISGCSPRSTTPAADEMLGNFPQALTHLSHLEAAVALAETTTATVSAP